MTMIKKAVSLAIVGALIQTSVFSPVQASSPQADARVELLTPPSELGTVVDARIASDRLDSPLVIQIQDLHANYEVQTKIAKLLEFYDSHLPSYQVAVEGAQGPVLVSELARLPDPAFKAEVGDKLLKAAELTGTEYFAIVHGKPNLLWGVEDERYHQANVELFKQTYQGKQQLAQALNKLQEDLLPIKGKFYARAQKKLDKKAADYASGKLDIADYTLYLVRQAEKQGIAIGSRYPEIAKWSGSAQPEKYADTDKLMTEQADLFKEVQAGSSKTDLQRNLAATTGGLELLKRLVSEELTTEEVRYLAPQLAQLGGQVDYLLKAAALDRHSRESGNPVALKSLDPRFRGGDDNGVPPLPYDQKNLGETLSASLDFYTLALLRDKYLADNALQLLRAPGSGLRNQKGLRSPEPRAQSRHLNDVVVLVTGGFHTPGITKILKEKGISYITVAPTVTSQTERDKKLYVARLLGRHASLDQLIVANNMLFTERNAPSTIEEVGEGVGANEARRFGLQPALQMLRRVRLPRRLADALTRGARYVVAGVNASRLADRTGSVGPGGRTDQDRQMALARVADIFKQVVNAYHDLPHPVYVDERITEPFLALAGVEAGGIDRVKKAYAQVRKNRAALFGVDKEAWASAEAILTYATILFGNIGKAPKIMSMFSTTWPPNARALKGLAAYHAGGTEKVRDAVDYLVAKDRTLFTDLDRQTRLDKLQAISAAALAIIRAGGIKQFEKITRGTKKTTASFDSEFARGLFLWNVAEANGDAKAVQQAFQEVRQAASQGKFGSDESARKVLQEDSALLILARAYLKAIEQPRQPVEPARGGPRGGHAAGLVLAAAAAPEDVLRRLAAGDKSVRNDIIRLHQVLTKHLPEFQTFLERLAPMQNHLEALGMRLAPPPSSPQDLLAPEKTPAIARVETEEIKDSRGKPTVRARAVLADGTVGEWFAVPAGKSKGTREAPTINDMGKARANIREALRQIQSRGYRVGQQADIDRLLQDHLSEWGAEATLAVSVAVLKAAAQVNGLTPADYIAALRPGARSNRPTPIEFYMNVLNGGEHVPVPRDQRLDAQEFMAVPHALAESHAEAYQKALDTGLTLHKTLAGMMERQGIKYEVGDEGGLAPYWPTVEGRNRQAIDFLRAAYQGAGYTPGRGAGEVGVALDVAATSFSHNGYHFEGKPRTPRWMIDWYAQLANEEPPVSSVEDPLDEGDWHAWSSLTAEIGRRMQVVGDDLFVTQLLILRRGINEKAANAILIKLNQNGTITGTLDAMEEAQNAGFGRVVSHRSGETDDTTIADLAVGTNAEGLKTGDPTQAVRRAKYERVIALAKLPELRRLVNLDGTPAQPGVEPAPGPEIVAKAAAPPAQPSGGPGSPGAAPIDLEAIGRRLETGDGTVVNDIKAYWDSLPADAKERQSIYEWLQHHESVLSADAIAAIGFHWPGVMPTLVGKIEGKIIGNPKSAARQLQELATGWTWGGLPVPLPGEVVFETLAVLGHLLATPEGQTRWKDLLKPIGVPAYPPLQPGTNPGVLVLVRHGETTWSEAQLNKWAGWHDSKVTEKGRREAFDAGLRIKVPGLDFQRAYASGLSRSQETLEQVLRAIGQTGIPVQYDAALNERDYGVVGGMVGWRRDLVASAFPEQYLKWCRGYKGDNARPPGGENLPDVQERTVPYLVNPILGNIVAGENISVSAHGNSLRASLIYLREHTEKRDLLEEEVKRLEVPLTTPIVVIHDPSFQRHRELWVDASLGPADVQRYLDHAQDIAKWTVADCLKPAVEELARLTTSKKPQELRIEISEKGEMSAAEGLDISALRSQLLQGLERLRTTGYQLAHPIVIRGGMDSYQIDGVFFAALATPAAAPKPERGGPPEGSHKARVLYLPLEDTPLHRIVYASAQLIADDRFDQAIEWLKDTAAALRSLLEISPDDHSQILVEIASGWPKVFGSGGLDAIREYITPDAVHAMAKNTDVLLEIAEGLNRIRGTREFHSGAGREALQKAIDEGRLGLDPEKLGLGKPEAAAPFSAPQGYVEPTPGLDSFEFLGIVYGAVQEVGRLINAGLVDPAIRLFTDLRQAVETRNLEPLRWWFEPITASPSQAEISARITAQVIGLYAEVAGKIERLSSGQPPAAAPVLRTIDDLAPGRSAFLKINWDIGDEGGETKIYQTIGTVKHVFEKFNELTVCTHYKRPRKKDLEESGGRDNFNVGKHVLPAVLEAMKAEGIDADVIELPESFEEMPAAIEAARRNPNRKPKIMFLLPNIRLYPEESSYYTGTQPSTDAQEEFGRRLYEALLRPEAYINEAIESHETDASVRMANLFPVEARSAGDYFASVVNMKLDFEARMTGPGLIVWGGKKEDKVQTFLPDFLSSEWSHPGDVMAIVGVLAFPFLKHLGHSVGQSTPPKPDHAQRVEQAVPRIMEAARERGITLLLPSDHVVEGVAGPVKEIGEDQAAVDIGEASSGDINSAIDRVIERYRASGEGWVIGSGSTGIFKKDAGRRGMRLLLEKLEEAAEAGVPALLLGGDMNDAIKEVEKKDWGGRKLNPKIKRTTAGGTILESLHTGIAGYSPVQALLKESQPPSPGSPAPVVEYSASAETIRLLERAILHSFEGLTPTIPEVFWEISRRLKRVNPKLADLLDSLEPFTRESDINAIHTAINDARKDMTGPEFRRAVRDLFFLALTGSRQGGGPGEGKAQRLTRSKAPSVARFLELLVNCLAPREGQGTVIVLRPGLEVEVDMQFVQTHRREILAGVEALRRAYEVEHGTKIQPDDVISYINLGGLSMFHLEQRDILILMGVGKALGLWDVLPGEGPTHKLSDLGTFLPVITNIDLAALAAAPTGSKHTPRGPKGLHVLAGLLLGAAAAAALPYLPMTGTAEAALVPGLSAADAPLPAQASLGSLLSWLGASAALAGLPFVYLGSRFRKDDPAPPATFKASVKLIQGLDQRIADELGPNRKVREVYDAIYRGLRPLDHELSVRLYTLWSYVAGEHIGESNAIVREAIDLRIIDIPDPVLHQAVQNLFLYALTGSRQGGGPTGPMQTHGMHKAFNDDLPGVAHSFRDDPMVQQKEGSFGSVPFQHKYANALNQFTGEDGAPLQQYEVTLNKENGAWSLDVWASNGDGTSRTFLTLSHYEDTLLFRVETASYKAVEYDGQDKPIAWEYVSTNEDRSAEFTTSNVRQDPMDAMRLERVGGAHELQFDLNDQDLARIKQELKNRLGENGLDVLQARGADFGYRISSQSERAAEKDRRGTRGGRVVGLALLVAGATFMAILAQVIPGVAAVKPFVQQEGAYYLGTLIQLLISGGGILGMAYFVGTATSRLLAIARSLVRRAFSSDPSAAMNSRLVNALRSLADAPGVFLAAANRASAAALNAVRRIPGGATGLDRKHRELQKPLAFSA